jgi:hypothetical protein
MGKPAPAQGITSGTSADSALNFPRQANDAAQLALVDKQYPESASLAARRAALEKTLDYFPNDRPARYLATVYLADIEASSTTWHCNRGWIRIATATTSAMR